MPTSEDLFEGPSSDPETVHARPRHHGHTCMRCGNAWSHTDPECEAPEVFDCPEHLELDS